MNWLTILLGAYLGFWLTLFVMPLIPNFIERLTNKPNRNRDDHKSTKDYDVSEFGFFTEVKPGRVKIIEKGGEFIRCVMSYEDHVFAGEVPGSDLRRNDDAYWEVLAKKEVPKKVKDSHPLPWKPSWIGWVLLPVSFFWWVWKRWVFKLTGYVFTGIYPFQRVRTDTLEYFVKQKEGSSSVGESDAAGNKHGEERIIRIEDYSDHFRVADFQFPVRVPSADTLDKIPVRVFVDMMARVFNPYQTAYWIDKWSSRLSAASVDAISHYTRARYYDDVISISKESEEREFSEEVVKIGNTAQDGSLTRNSVVPIGIRLSQALILDISPVREEDGVALGEEARARAEKKAMVERAEGRSAEIRKQAEAVRDNGHIGLAVLASERNVRTATAAGDKAIVIVGGSADADPIQAAILHELKQLNEGKSS
jgi:regulator of protease activity HflC (stomatin/prohibitin superfamily)